MTKVSSVFASSDFAIALHYEYCPSNVMDDVEFALRAVPLHSLSPHRPSFTLLLD